MAVRKFRVFRGEKRETGELRDYSVDCDEGMVVLDAVHRIQAEESPELACRWNCKAGKCGSCSAEINGKPKLMCMTRLSDYDPGETLTVTPLRSFPVIKDLCCDVSKNFENNRNMPYFQPRKADFENGEFQIDNLAQGSFTLTVDAKGYRVARHNRVQVGDLNVQVEMIKGRFFVIPIR